MFDAALQGAVLAGISGVLVWVGYMKLVDAEPYATWKRRRTAQRASADLKKLQIEYERTDTNYRQALQALRLAWFECESRNPRLVAAIEDELAMTPSPEPPHYRVGDGQVPRCHPAAALGCSFGHGRADPVRAVLLVATVVLAAAAVSVSAGAAGATGTPSSGTNVLVVMNPSKRAVNTEVRHVKEIFGQVSTLPGLRFFGIYEQRSSDDGPPFDRPFVMTQTPETAALKTLSTVQRDERHGLPAQRVQESTKHAPRTRR